MSSVDVSVPGLKPIRLSNPATRLFGLFRGDSICVIVYERSTGQYWVLSEKFTNRVVNAGDEWYPLFAHAASLCRKAFRKKAFICLEAVSSCICLGKREYGLAARKRHYVYVEVVKVPLEYEQDYRAILVRDADGLFVQLSTQPVVLWKILSAIVEAKLVV